MGDKSVIFIGMLRDSQKTLPRILEQLNEITCVFNRTYFLFFESNSVDNTSNILMQWSKNTSLQANNGQYMEYCHQMDSNAASFPHIIEKKLLFGDAFVQHQFDEYVESKSNTTYAHKMSRVEKFVPMRNMLLQQLYGLDLQNIDYIFMIDLDVHEIDFYAFLRELNDCPHDIMCANGVEWFNYYRDSFASVDRI